MYERDEWLLYDRYQDNAYINHNYMNFQINQMRQIAELANDNDFYDIADRWQGFVTIKKKEAKSFLNSISSLLLNSINQGFSLLRIC